LGSQLCSREGISRNIFLLASWSQTEEDVRFAYTMAEYTRGRVFFTARGGNWIAVLSGTTWRGASKLLAARESQAGKR
jgi:hypothetical protein